MRSTWNSKTVVITRRRILYENMALFEPGSTIWKRIDRQFVE